MEEKLARDLFEGSVPTAETMLPVFFFMHLFEKLIIQAVLRRSPFHDDT
jgi:hypothetical protein